MDALLLSESPPDVLVRLTDVLAITPGQELVARKLRDGYNQLSKRVPTADVLMGPPPIPFDFSELSQLFQQTLHGIMNAFDDSPNILEVLKEILHSPVLPLGNGKVVMLVEEANYQHAKTHRDVFQLMTPYWNCLSTDLLQLLIEASGCSLAAMKLSEFIQARSSKGHSVLCCSQDSSKSQRDDMDRSISPGHRSVHTGPLVALQSPHSASLPEQKTAASRNTIRITAEVNKPLLSLSDYEAVTAAVSVFLSLPEQALVYAGCSVIPTVLCWLVSEDILPYIKAVSFGLGVYHPVVVQSISGIAVGDVISYKCPSMKEVELWEASYYGVVEKVCDLLQSVNVDSSDIEGFTPLHLACLNGHSAVVSLLLERGADLRLRTNCHGSTPLHSACQNGHSAIVSLLLEHAADLHQTTNKGPCVTPLMLACYFGRSEVVNILIEAKADINQMSGRGKITALMCAAKNGHLEVINKLIQNGANIHVKNESRHTATDLARQKGHTEVYQVLRDQPSWFGTWWRFFTK